MDNQESGQEFELRGLNLSRALHDPLGLQGAILHKGSERDALFVGEQAIHAYEFTVDRLKAKSEKDASKLAELLTDFSKKPENAYKSLTGWSVTRDEPTADQRGAVAAISKSSNVTIHSISISTLQQRICNSESYLRCRDNAPFGSTAYSSPASVSQPKVTVRLVDGLGEPSTLEDLLSATIEGERAMVVGNFGVGKSYSMRELYKMLRREHFRRKKLTPFPLHINLRDCAGLKTPAEILRRHAEEIGFPNGESLVSAWRAGACILLLDGFDEIVPVRWLGGASDLRNVRWEALSPVRRLIDETPAGVGIVASGRSHYFSSHAEMAEALGLRPKQILTLPDFDEAQVQAYLDQAKVTWALPEWMPTRPLLIGYLVDMGELRGGDFLEKTSQAAAWRALFDQISLRESKMFAAVRPEVIKAIVARVATLARSTGNEVGPVNMELMRTAFIDVNNRQPDEEGLQLLLRLPGLANSGSEVGSESRVFVDRDLADTAYGEDLARYLANPHDSAHPLGGVASWVTASSSLGIEVAADLLQENQFAGRAVLAVAALRQNAGKFDAIMSDTLRVASLLGVDPQKTTATFVVEGVIFDQLVLGPDDIVLARTHFQDCIFQTLDVSSVDQDCIVPHFQGGMIGLLEGVSNVPPWMSGSFVGTEIERFSVATQTTAGILQLSLDMRTRVALSVLKKVFSQSGSGRKESALFRGLGQSAREIVPSVLAVLISEGWIRKSSAGTNVIYVGVRGRRAEAMAILASPSESWLSV